ncbi:hypothetical protein LTR02_017155 [Friedmanniomyces endolithicus]|nr:hypothetical protein LTS09_008265 [Friedmanniomyces endolithicus]KAK0768533.1 hypothetical protein LTR59_017596 [Friedmanniomyces endolithicus]KAK0772145.1 hypothetical protein LTR75_017486 [Friedmanniomyces endolithicus]KAK0826254.1 hypothetical protein LTR03_017234 [Friedmanniomyces endolithicus]KAK0860239.1 hypothetical protein LTR87_017363 [Friedmanniomyces endolithicus]
MSARDRRRDNSTSRDEPEKSRRREGPARDRSDADQVDRRRLVVGDSRTKAARRHDRRQDFTDSEGDQASRPHRQKSEPSGDSSHRPRIDELSSRGSRRTIRSRSPDYSRHREHSREPPAKKQRRPETVPKSPPRKSRTALPSQDQSFRGETGIEGTAAPPEKQKPNFKPTGLLAKEANTVAGTTTVLKYHEPPEARKPSSKEQWRMYIFKQKDLLETIYLHERSVWLCGRDKKVTDLFLEHPSISKQHAVIQFRYITSTNEYGDKSSKVKPYLIDLDSANGTKLNGKKVDGSKFVELLDGDVVAFGDTIDFEMLVNREAEHIVQ